MAAAFASERYETDLAAQVIARAEATASSRRRTERDRRLISERNAVLPRQRAASSPVRRRCTSRPARASGEVFVFCHPLAEEKLWAHRVFVAYARQLAASGARGAARSTCWATATATATSASASVRHRDRRCPRRHRPGADAAGPPRACTCWAPLRRHHRRRRRRAVRRCRAAGPVGADRRRRAVHAGAAAHQPGHADRGLQRGPPRSQPNWSSRCATAPPSTSTATRWRTRCTRKRPASSWLPAKQVHARARA